MIGSVEFNVVKIHKPEDVNLILGQSHFIKTVEDISETIVSAVPNAKFGLAFCESSGDCLIRLDGNDNDLIALARCPGDRGRALLCPLPPGLLPDQCPERDQDDPGGLHHILCNCKRG